MREWLDPRRYNGAVMLGLNGVVVKSHGGTDAEGFAHAVDVAMDMVVHGFNDEDPRRAWPQIDALRLPDAGRRSRPDRVTHARACIAGVGGYLPERVVTNDELARTVDTTDDWIVERTGIRQRHLAGAARDLRLHGDARRPGGARRCRRRTRRRGRGHPGHRHARPGLPGHRGARPGGARHRHGFGFDISAACSGFVYALSVADAHDPHRPGRAARW